MIVPMRPRRPVEIPPGVARVLLAAAVPTLAVAVVLVWFRDRDAVAQPASSVLWARLRRWP